MIHLQQSVYFVLTSLGYWEPEEKLKQRSDTVSYTCMFFRMRQAAVLNATKAMDRGSRQTRKERTAVAEAIQ